MMDLRLLVTVFRSDGKQEDFPIEPGAPVSLGSLPGCTIPVSDQGLFMFTLLSWDLVARCYLLHLTDAMRGELRTDGVGKPLAEFRRDGTAQGVESLGLWTMPLPVPCSGDLTVAGIKIQFALEGAQVRKSTFRPILQTGGDESVPDIPVIIRRRRA